MSGPFKPEEVELTPAFFTGDARISWVIGAVPLGTQTKGTLLLERLPQDFPRHSTAFLEKVLHQTLLKLRGQHGFAITGDITRLSGMHIERSIP